MTPYERIGGAPAVAAAVERFYVRVLADPYWSPSSRMSTSLASRGISWHSYPKRWEGRKNIQAPRCREHTRD